LGAGLLFLQFCAEVVRSLERPATPSASSQEGKAEEERIEAASLGR
jgi:hypothetical protein